MPSFSKMAIFPVGYFRATAEWLLRERRDVVICIDTLQAELLRIGEVKMDYRPLKEGAGIKMSEQRRSFTVTKGSSLARLVQAYIAQGGDPFDISGFLHPDSTEWVETDSGWVQQQKYPGGGFIAPESVGYNAPFAQPMSEEGSVPPEETGFGSGRAGMIQSHRYTPGRMYGRLDRGGWDYSTVNRLMHDVRKWANKEIKTRLQDMEWRILKLSDLAEQLTQERDIVLMEAFAGQLNNMPLLDSAQIDPKRLCQVLIQDMYTLLYETKAGIVLGFRANVETGFLRFTYPDVPEDVVGQKG